MKLECHAQYNGEVRYAIQSQTFFSIVQLSEWFSQSEFLPGYVIGYTTEKRSAEYYAMMYLVYSFEYSKII